MLHVLCYIDHSEGHPKVPCLTLWESTTLVYLAIYGWCRQQCCAIVATRVLASITSSKWHGRDSINFRACPHAIKSCLPHVYPGRHAHEKMYQALSFLSGESLGMRLVFLSWQPGDINDWLAVICTSNKAILSFGRHSLYIWVASHNATTDRHL